MIQQPFVNPGSTFLGTPSCHAEWCKQNYNMSPRISTGPAEDVYCPQKKKSNNKKWWVAGGIALATLTAFLLKGKLPAKAPKT